MRRLLAWAAVPIALTYMATVALAQVAVPPAIDPGRIQQQLQPPKPGQAQPEIVAPQISDNIPPAAAAETRITLQSIEVEGSTIYPASQFQAETQSLTGHEIRLVEVFKLADRITAHYRRDGYILSRAVIPAQKLENGKLRVQIVEGYVHAVSFRGKHSHLLEKYGAEIVASKPLRQDVLERYLLLMNALPGVSARAVLAPSQEAAGGTDITIVTTEKTVDGYVSIDNHGSHYLGTLEGSAGFGLNDLLGLGERTSFSYATAYPNATLHEHELSYFEGREDLPLGSDGLLLSVSGERITGTPGLTLAPLDTHTSGTGADVVLSYPLISSRARTWTTELTLSYLNSKADIDNQPYLPPSYDDRIRALRIGTTYDFADHFGGHNLADVILTQGLPVFAASDRSDTDVSQPGARSDFHKLTLNLSRRQDLDGLVSNLDLYGALFAQTSFGEKLLSSEQFGLGGPTFGRGYDPSELTGDKGIAGKTELQYNQQVGRLSSAFQYFGFYDVGVIGNSAPAAGIPASQSLASAGGGVRFALPLGFSGSLELDKPLTKPVEAEVIMRNPHPKDPRVGFSIVDKF